MRGEELFGKGASDYAIKGGGVRAMGGDGQGGGRTRGERKMRGEGRSWSAREPKGLETNRSDKGEGIEDRGRGAEGEGVS